MGNNRRSQRSDPMQQRQPERRSRQKNYTQKETEEYKKRAKRNADDERMLRKAEKERRRQERIAELYAEEPVPERDWKNTLINGGLKVVSVLASAAIIIGLGLNLPIVSYRTEESGAMNVERISYMDKFKRAQPAILQEGELQKIDPADVEALDLRDDVDPETTNDGLNLDQIVEGQYTMLFMGMDESGQLADVNWLFQFDLVAGTMNVLQIPRDCYVPD